MTAATFVVITAVAIAATPEPGVARPAVVRVFEAEAHAAPASDAPVVHRFPERTELSVSEEAQVAPLPLGLPPPPPKPDLRPRVFVEDAGQLPRLMQKDPAFSEKAQALAGRRTAAWVAAGLGVAASFAFAAASMNSLSSQTPADPSSAKPPDGAIYGLAGVASLALGSLVAVAVYPSRSEVLDLVNGWNISHPEDPLQVTPVIVAAARPGAPLPEPPSADVGPRMVVPATGGPPVMATPIGGGMYLPVTGGPPIPGVP